MQNASLLIGLCLILALAPNGWKDCFEKRFRYYQGMRLQAAVMIASKAAAEAVAVANATNLEAATTAHGIIGKGSRHLSFSVSWESSGWVFSLQDRGVRQSTYRLDRRENDPIRVDQIPDQRSACLEKYGRTLI